MGGCLCACLGAPWSSWCDRRHARSFSPPVTSTSSASTMLARASGRRSHMPQDQPPADCIVDPLVLSTLNNIRLLVDVNQDPPRAMLSLHLIADEEAGWQRVVMSLINVVPLSDPLGPAVILLLLDDCPLPTKEMTESLLKQLNITEQYSPATSCTSHVQTKPSTSHSSSANTHINNNNNNNSIDSRSCCCCDHTNDTRLRNICVVFGCLAEKMAGPPSLWLLTAPTLAFLLHVLIHHETASVILFALIALEKFAQTSENKLSINEKLCSLPVHPLLRLESWLYDDAEDFDKQQVGLCAQWCLDNLFMVEGRQFTYETVDMSQSRAVLNNYDTSEYLKITADGLQARCDTSSFESARCTFCVHSGCWYYEVTVVTSGVMQIGWATKNSRFLNHEGYGIGDDSCSVAYDGCRCLLWHDARATSHHHRRWGPGDVLGALIDLDLGHCVFSLNGDPLTPFTDLFKNTKSGFFAAASFMSFQQCRFNFGASPFKFPPSRWRYQCFNDHGTLSPAQRSIIPRHMKLERLREGSVCEDACTLCFDKPASVTLLPCSHRGFCGVCAQQLTQCPLCRSSIMSSVT